MNKPDADTKPVPWDDDPEYQQFVDECAKSCTCDHGVCGGVLSGGFCDEINDERGLCEDERDEYQSDDE